MTPYRRTRSSRFYLTSRGHTRSARLKRSVQPLRVVVDAYFATASFIKLLMEKGIAVILRLRKNTVGWDDAPEYSGRGRPRKKGKQWKLAELLKARTAESLIYI
ncbi:MAG: transposase [Methanophagales archaeon]|nr:transposase [Methanophagales archaeon]